MDVNKSTVNMTPQLIVALTGKIASGKSTAAAYLMHAYGFRKLSFVDSILSKELARRGLPVNRVSLQTIGAELYKKHGDRKLVEWLLSDLQAKEHIVIDDVRYPTTVQYIRNKFPSKFWLIVILASPRLRYQRIIERSASERKMTWDHFLEIDEAFTESQIEEVVKIADFTIVNDSIRDRLISELDKLIPALQSTNSRYDNSLC